jgi:hypothetical protein
MNVPQQWRRNWPLFVLAALVLLFFGDLVVQGRTLMMRDTFCDFLPWRLFEREALRAGRMPLWNPLSGFGKPFVADPQAAAFYPLHLPFYVLPAAWALKVSWTLHLWIAAASMYALARYWQLRTAAALIAAVSFGFSTWMIAYMEFLSALTTAAWGPLIVWRTLVVVDRLSDNATGHTWAARVWRHRGAIAVLALALAVQYLAGHPEHTMHMLLLTAIFLAVRCIIRRDVTTLKSVAVTAIVAGALAAAVILPQFLLSWELVQHSNRAAGVDPQLDVASAAPKQFLGLLLPFAFGRPGYGNYWATTIFEFWAGTCYLGILPLLLTGFAVSLFRKKGLPEDSLHRELLVTALVILVVGALMSLGQYTPLYSFVFSHVPGFDRVRWPSKYLLWVVYGLTFLTALGYQSILAPHGSRLRRGNALRLPIALYGSGLVVVLLALAYFSGALSSLTSRPAPLDPVEVLQTSWDVLVTLVFGVVSVAFLIVRVRRPIRSPWLDAIAVAVIFFNLLVVGRQIQPVASDAIYQTEKNDGPGVATGPAGGRIYSSYAEVQQSLYGRTDPALFEWARRAGAGDSWIPLGVYQVWQGGMNLQRYTTFLSLMSSVPPAGAERLANLSGVRFVAGGAAFDDVVRHPSREVVIGGRDGGMSRAYAVTRWSTVHNEADALVRVQDDTFDPGREAIIEPVTGAAGAEVLIPESPAADREPSGRVRILADRMNGIDLEARVDHRSLLVLGDAWYPGWVARVDGRRQPIFRVNYLFRGIFVEPGEHQVAFDYEPWQLRHLIWLSVAVFAGLVWAAFSRTGHPHSATPAQFLS